MAADPLTTSAVDDLFNDNFSDFDDDPFTDKPNLQDTRDDKPVLSPRAGLKRRAGDDDGLGLDEEVKIAKKRRPIAKLDEARLLSEPGIPKLRSIVHSKHLSKKLKIKGKGHEFTDAARLLNHFQLWLDNLYPRAKFADALQLVEKAGHSKRMHIMRTEWINEGRPGYKTYETTREEDEMRDDPDLFGAQAQTNAPSTRQADMSAQTSDPIFEDGLDEDALFIPDVNRPSQLNRDDEPDDDELDALLAAQDEPGRMQSSRVSQQRQEESEGEDDLDALLAEQNTIRNRPAQSAHSQPAARLLEEEDEDDLDALLAEHDREKADTRQLDGQQSNSQLNVESDDDDDLEALLAMQRTRSKTTTDDIEPSLPTPQHTSSPLRHANGSAERSDETAVNTTIAPMFSSSPIPNNPEELDLDDLDALLASQEAKTAAKEQAREEQRTPRARKVMDAMDDLLSSPIPNE